MNEHGPEKELRDVRVLRHRFELSLTLRNTLGEFFDQTQTAVNILGAYATRELLLDEDEYRRHRYHDFIEFNQQEFEKYRRKPVFLGRPVQTLPVIRFHETSIGRTPITRIALRPRDQHYLNDIVEAMNIMDIDADPYLAPYDDIRPKSGDHYLTIDVKGGKLLEENKRKFLERRFGFNAMSLEHKKLYYVRPETIEHKLEYREVIPHPPYETQLSDILDLNSDPEVA